MLPAPLCFAKRGAYSTCIQRYPPLYAVERGSKGVSSCSHAMGQGLSSTHKYLLNYLPNCDKFAVVQIIRMLYGTSMRNYRDYKCWKDNNI